METGSCCTLSTKAILRLWVLAIVSSSTMKRYPQRPEANVDQRPYPTKVKGGSLEHVDVSENQLY